LLTFENLKQIALVFAVLVAVAYAMEAANGDLELAESKGKKHMSSGGYGGGSSYGSGGSSYGSGGSSYGGGKNNHYCFCFYTNQNSNTLFALK
jgi:uncharacterized membrane protein YgcG